MGAVYQARDMKRQGTVCAVKEMSTSMVPPDEREQAIDNFKIEAKILWGLNHPNLPALMGFFSENQRYFLVMEYIDGMTLEQLLERNGGPFSERRVLGWARQLCDVLEYLHSQNPPIIFRDMKPGNVMLTRSGHIKLVDFGIARFFRPTGVQDTQHLGTPGFAPPEQYGTAQTDVRSDIYSLAMTLFLLLTNELSEQGFGLQNVRAINPKISPVVARALEKAADMKPELRYQSVAEFRAALLGVGFVFDCGDLAINAQELAELCAHYPDEAANYLSTGEIEAWLHETGQFELAREAQHIRTMIADPHNAVDSFVQIVTSQNARARRVQQPLPRRSNQSGKQPAIGRNKGAQSGQNGASQTPAAKLGNLEAKRSRVPIQVHPRGIDFGQVQARNISSAMTLTITGEQGVPISGTLYSHEPWMMLDTTQFAGMSTRVGVRINGMNLRGGRHYTGAIVIVPDDESAQKDILVPVEVEVIEHTPQFSTGHERPRRLKTANADLDVYDDDDDDEYDDDAINSSTTQVQQFIRPDEEEDEYDDTAVSTGRIKPDKQSEYEAKYGASNVNGSSKAWEPLHMSLQQRLWVQRCLTFVAAFILASLVYTLTTQAPTSPLPPSPWFIVTLACGIPAAALGALLVNWNRNWPPKEAINRTCTGMSSVLVLLALLRIVVQIASTTLFIPPQAHLLLMLTAISLGATFGITRKTSDAILDGIIWILQQVNRRPASLGLGIIGGIVGYLLTVGFALSPFTMLAIVVGIAVGTALAWRANQIMDAGQP
jgi:serine/threonine protein kinase